GLILSDGRLIAQDLYSRRLDCDLVTLSGCDTGNTVIGPGDEFLGLARAFLHAGARSVLVSLWDASDISTMLLMKEFYSGLARGMNKRAELRSAQQSLRASYPNPFHWAPFTLIGSR